MHENSLQVAREPRAPFCSSGEGWRRSWLVTGVFCYSAANSCPTSPRGGHGGLGGMKKGVNAENLVQAAYAAMEDKGDIANTGKSLSSHPVFIPLDSPLSSHPLLLIHLHFPFSYFVFHPSLPFFFPFTSFHVLLIFLHFLIHLLLLSIIVFSLSLPSPFPPVTLLPLSVSFNPSTIPSSTSCHCVPSHPCFSILTFSHFSHPPLSPPAIPLAASCPFIVSSVVMRTS